MRQEDNQRQGKPRAISSLIKIYQNEANSYENSTAKRHSRTDR